MTLTISLTWVARFTLPSTRCERSPKPRHRRREHLVPALLQTVGHAPLAPAAVPSAVHEHEGLRRAGLRRCWRAAQSGCARAGPCACQHAAAGHGHVVGCSHRVLPMRCLLAQSYLGRARSSRTAQTENVWACVACPPYPATRPPCG